MQNSSVNHIIKLFFGKLWESDINSNYLAFTPPGSKKQCKAIKSIFSLYAFVENVGIFLVKYEICHKKTTKLYQLNLVLCTKIIKFR